MPSRRAKSVWAFIRNEVRAGPIVQSATIHKAAPAEVITELQMKMSRYWRILLSSSLCARRKGNRIRATIKAPKNQKKVVVSG